MAGVGRYPVGIISTPSPMPEPRPIHVPRWLAWCLLPVVTLGFAALWTLVALLSDRQASWMAVIGAIDVLWLLGLVPSLQAPSRAVLATLATAVIVACANWAIIASHVGAQLGAGPLEAIGKLGIHHAWTLAGLANARQDGVWIALALALSASAPWLSDRRRALSAR